MEVEVNVLSMHTNFDGCRRSGFGDIATFKNGQIIGVHAQYIDFYFHDFFIVHGHQKILSFGIGSKNSCK